MAVKDIMAQLHEAVYSSFATPQLHFHRVIKPLQNAGLSEIAIYRLTAEYMEENDIPVERMVEDVKWLLTELSKNLMIVRTSDRFYWLAKQINELKRSKYDDEHFICTSCHYMKRNTLKVGPTANQCKECAANAAKVYQQRAKDKPKKKDEPKKETETEAEKPTPDVPAVQATNAPRDLGFGRFITFTDLMTDTDAGEVTVLMTCDLTELKNALEVIDPYLIKDKKPKQGDQDEVAAEEDEQETGEGAH